MNLLLFSVGAAFGAPIRFWIDNRFRAKYKFPIGILIVNILGSFLIGLYANHMNYLVVGFCGGLTTFSSVMLLSNEFGYAYILENLFMSLLVISFVMPLARSSA